MTTMASFSREKASEMVRKLSLLVLRSKFGLEFPCCAIVLRREVAAFKSASGVKVRVLVRVRL